MQEARERRKFLLMGKVGVKKVSVINSTFLFLFYLFLASVIR